MSSIATVAIDASDTPSLAAFAPNATTVAAMLDARAGQTTRVNSVEELVAQLTRSDDEPMNQALTCAR
jgi:hypothetical protein